MRFYQDKEFQTALFVFLFLAGASVITALSFNSSTDFNNLYEILHYRAGNYANIGIWFYAPFAQSKEILKFALCFLPSILFSIMIRQVSGQRAAILSAVGIPFILAWDNIAQSVVVLFFLVAIGLKLRKSGLGGALYALLCALLHRYGAALAILYVAFSLPIEHLFSKRQLQIVLALMVALSIVVFFAVLFLFGLDKAPCQLFNRQTFIILPPIWVLAVLYCDKKFLILSIVCLAACFIIFFVGMQDQPQRRLVFIAEAIMIYGIAVSGKPIHTVAILIMLFASLSVIALRTIDETERTFQQTDSAEGAREIYYSCNAETFAGLTYEKGVGTWTLVQKCLTKSPN